jgi:hypothetical protein
MGCSPHAWPGDDCPLTRAPQRDYGEDGTGVAGGKAFVEVGMVASGSGVVAVAESGELLVLADGLLVRGAVATDGAAWVVVSVVAVEVLGVSLCWLHPHNNNPTNALAATIWIFCIDFIFIIPFSWCNRK